MNTLSRLDVFFISFFRSLPYPVAYVAKTLLGLLAIPVLLVGAVIWVLVFGLHWIGNRVVESVKSAINYDQ